MKHGGGDKTSWCPLMSSTFSQLSQYSSPGMSPYHTQLVQRHSVSTWMWDRTHSHTYTHTLPHTSNQQARPRAQRRHFFLPGWLFVFCICFFPLGADFAHFHQRLISVCQMQFGSQMYEHEIEDVTSGEMWAVQHIELRICCSFQVSSVLRFTEMEMIQKQFAMEIPSRADREEIVIFFFLPLAGTSVTSCCNIIILFCHIKACKWAGTGIEKKTHIVCTTACVKLVYDGLWCWLLKQVQLGVMLKSLPVMSPQVWRLTLVFITFLRNPDIHVLIFIVNILPI